MREEAAPLLDRFLAGLRETLPPVAVWAHGSLAMGDFQPGRSDLDLIAVVEAAPDAGQLQRLERLHRDLAARFPQARTLHCSYMVRDQLADPAVRHLTWAHEEITARPVTEVSRRELHAGNLALFGPPPTELLPAVSDEELAAFIRADLRDFWLPATAKRTRWLQDVWIDLGLLVYARATVTLREGRLITKGQALDTLPGLGAPALVLTDIRARRYGTPPELSAVCRVRRAHVARVFLRKGIRRTLADG